VRWCDQWQLHLAVVRKLYHILYELDASLDEKSLVSSQLKFTLLLHNFIQFDFSTNIEIKSEEDTRAKH